MAELLLLEKYFSLKWYFYVEFIVANEREKTTCALGKGWLQPLLSTQCDKVSEKPR